jgi:hypothetical protein
MAMVRLLPAALDTVDSATVVSEESASNKIVAGFHRTGLSPDSCPRGGGNGKARFSRKAVNCVDVVSIRSVSLVDIYILLNKLICKKTLLISCFHPELQLQRLQVALLWLYCSL